MGKRSEVHELWTGNAENIVWGVAISKEAEYVAAGSWDNYVYFFDKTGQLLWKNKTSDYVKSVAISKNAEFITAGSYDKNIYAFNKNGRLIWRYKTESYVRGVSISENGEIIAAGSWSGTLYSLDKKGGLLWKKELGSPILSVSVSWNGERIVAVCEDKKVYAFSKNEKLLWKYESDYIVMSVSTSESGDYVALGSADKYVSLLDKNGKLLWKVEIGNTIKSISMTSDGKTILACASDKYVYAIDKEGKLLWIHKTKFDPWDLACSGTGAFFAVSTRNNAVIFYENKYAYQQLANLIKEKLTTAKVAGIDTTKAEDLYRDGESLATQHEMEKATAQLGASVAILENSILDSQAKELEKIFFSIDAKLKHTKDKKESMRLERVLARAKGLASSKAYAKAIEYVTSMKLDLEIREEVSEQMKVEPALKQEVVQVSSGQTQVVQTVQTQAVSQTDTKTEVKTSDKPERIILRPKAPLKVILDYPKDNEILTSENYTIKAHTSDDADTIDVSIRIDNFDWNKMRKGADGLWAFDWNNISNGEHQLTIQGVSKSGRVSEITCKVSANILKAEPKPEIKPVTEPVKLTTETKPVEPKIPETKPVCPGCARAIDVRWNLCPYCHTKLGARCTKCTSKLEPDGTCMNCSVQSQIQNMENEVLVIAAKGVNVDGARTLLKRAVELHGNRDFMNAVQAATDALNAAKAAQSAHLEIMSIIDAARKDFDTAKNEGKDVSKASSEYDTVMLSLQKGDFESAKAHALEFQKLVKEAMESKGAPVVIKIGVKSGPTCPTCGKRVNERWKLCPYCKTKLK
ncbi:MAG: PQQ-binding-like beta-propeller repeat protein [Thermoplasmata archaeon]